MTRGKYGAKAANRLAAFDNELLTEKTAEVAQLQQQLATLRAELAAERADRGALVIARADELAAQQIAAIRTQTNEQLAAHTAAAHQAADLLTTYFHRQHKYPYDYMPKILPLLIPDQLARSEHIERHGHFNRDTYDEAYGVTKKFREAQEAEL